MPTPRLAPSLLLATLLCSPAFAEEPPKPPAGEGLKVDAKALEKKPAEKAGPLSREHMMKRSDEIARGYYNALIAGDFERAGTFLHPDVVEPLRESVLGELEKSGEQKRAATLKALGIPDVQTLKTLPASRFFAAYAKSSYGRPLQALSAPELAVRVAVENQVCSPQRRFCAVHVRIHGKRNNKERVQFRHDVYVVEHQGQWLLSEKQPAL